MIEHIIKDLYAKGNRTALNVGREIGGDLIDGATYLLGHTRSLRYVTAIGITSVLVGLAACAGVSDKITSQDPAISPDGKRIVYQRRDHGNWDVYVMNLPERQDIRVETKSTRLTANRANEINPAWCGGSIVYASDDYGNFDIWRMNPDGTGQVRLTANSAEETNPVCSLTGNEIIYVSDITGKKELHSMNPDGSAQIGLNVGIFKRE